MEDLFEGLETLAEKTVNSWGEMAEKNGGVVPDLLFELYHYFLQSEQMN